MRTRFLLVPISCVCVLLVTLTGCDYGAVKALTPNNATGRASFQLTWPVYAVTSTSGAASKIASKTHRVSQNQTIPITTLVIELDGKDYAFPTGANGSVSSQQMINLAVGNHAYQVVEKAANGTTISTITNYIPITAGAATTVNMNTFLLGPIASVKIDPKNPVMHVNSDLTITAHAYDAFNHEYDSSMWEWTVSESNAVITLNFNQINDDDHQSGSVHANLIPGTATITCYPSEAPAVTCSITVSVLD